MTRTHHLPPADVRPLDRIPALEPDGDPYIVGTVEQIDAQHPHTGRRPHWQITDHTGRRPYRYDDTHRCIVHREEARP